MPARGAFGPSGLARFGKESTQRSFKKSGIAFAIDGSEDEQINIEGLDGYSVEDVGDATYDDDDDPFMDLDD